MGIFHATEEFEAQVQANLGTEIANVAAAEGATLDTEFTVFRRERAETFAPKVTGAGVGIWVRIARTGAVRQGRRDWDITLAIDYVYSGGDRRRVAEQVELALDAIMRVIDGISNTGTILGAAGPEFGTTAVHDLQRLLQQAAGKVAQHSPVVAGYRIFVPVRQRDEVS